MLTYEHNKDLSEYNNKTKICYYSKPCILQYNKKKEKTLKTNFMKIIVAHEEE